MQILELILPSIEAEDELKSRFMSATLTPDRYKYLLLQTGSTEAEAETSRAKFELDLIRAKRNG